MFDTRGRQWAALLICAIAMGGAIACPKPLPPAAARPECPRDSIFIPRDTGLVVTHEVAASGPISMVPEYHDCQRFVSEREDAFGSLIAIFASSGLDSVADPPPGPYSTANIVFTGRDNKAAATILNYDAPYEPLRIEKGINCLYLFTTNGVWNARIFSASSDQDCLDPFPASNGGRPLAVTVDPSQRRAMPPVARWDWDSRQHEHYIGIRCGTQWCEVYNPSRPALLSSNHYDGSPEVGIKGLYDEQNLAVPSTGGPGVLVPGGVIGTIFPVGDLVANRESDFDRIWKQVAMVSLSGDSPTYKDKFNFIAGPAPAGNTTIWLCKGDKSACQIPSTSSVNDCDDKGDHWFAKIVSATLTKYRCVIRRQHPSVPIPGAVRWRWKNTDDDMWVRCPTGCCEIT